MSQIARDAEFGFPYPNKPLSPAALEPHERDRRGEVVRRGGVTRFVIENHFGTELNRQMSIFSHGSGPRCRPSSDTRRTT